MTANLEVTHNHGVGMELDSFNDLPNGWHDAVIERIHVDYARREAMLEIEAWVGDMTSSEMLTREAYRKCHLFIVDLLFLAIEPPKAEMPYESAKALTVDSGNGSGHPTEFRLPLPPGAFLQWFYVHSWGSMIHIAGMGARIEWQGCAYVPNADPKA